MDIVVSVEKVRIFDWVNKFDESLVSKVYPTNLWTCVGGNLFNIQQYST